jgi:hypothetical protein
MPVELRRPERGCLNLTGLRYAFAAELASCWSHLICQITHTGPPVTAIVVPTPRHKCKNGVCLQAAKVYLRLVEQGQSLAQQAAALRQCVRCVLGGSVGGKRDACDPVNGVAGLWPPILGLEDVFGEPAVAGRPAGNAMCSPAQSPLPTAGRRAVHASAAPAVVHDRSDPQPTKVPAQGVQAGFALPPKAPMPGSASPETGNPPWRSSTSMLPSHVVRGGQMGLLPGQIGANASLRSEPSTAMVSFLADFFSQQRVRHDQIMKVLDCAKMDRFCPRLFVLTQGSTTPRPGRIKLQTYVGVLQCP